MDEIFNSQLVIQKGQSCWVLHMQNYVFSFCVWKVINDRATWKAFTIRILMNFATSQKKPQHFDKCSCTLICLFCIWNENISWDISVSHVLTYLCNFQNVPYFLVLSMDASPSNPELLPQFQLFLRCNSKNLAVLH